MKTTIVLAVAVAAALAGCGQRADERAAGQAAGSSTRTVPGESKTASDGAAGGTNAMGAPAAPKSALGDKTDDGRITGLVMSGLKADRELNPLRIDVDTQAGVVTLSGSVPTAAAKVRAAEIAHNVKDVKSVNNQLTLSSS
jgi:hyperosmotically inducible protein